MNIATAAQMREMDRTAIEERGIPSVQLMEAAACAVAMVVLDVWAGAGALVGATLACLYYVATAKRQFGGVTGDLAGLFLQLCELGMVLCVAVAQRIEVLV